MPRNINLNNKPADEIGRGRPEAEKQEGRTEKARRKYGYFGDTQSILPQLPKSKSFHYQWVRVAINNQRDGANIAAHMHNPNMPVYEPVTASMIAEDFGGDFAERMSYYKSPSEQVFMVGDLQLMRTRKEDAEEYSAYLNELAEKQARMVNPVDDLREFHRSTGSQHFSVPTVINDSGYVDEDFNPIAAPRHRE